MKRKGHHVHYERMMESFFRDNGMLYLAIDEAKRPKLGDVKWKNFDFLVFRKKGFLMVDVKGKFFPYISGKAKNYWENWMTQDDVTFLLKWEKKFAVKNGKAIFCFPYLLNDPEALGKIQALPAFRKSSFTYTWKGNTYALLALEAEVYKKLMKHRSEKYDAVYVSRELFMKKVKPLAYFL